MDFTDEEGRAIGMMLKASKTAPDICNVEAVQELACLFIKIEPLLSASQKATIIGAGALIAHHGKAEMMARIEASMAIGRAQHSLRGKHG